MSDLDARIAALAARQHGSFHLRQLVTLGGSGDLARRRLDQRRWERAHHSVYLIAGTVDSLMRRAWAAHLAAGSTSVVSHQTAGRLHALSAVPDEERAHVTSTATHHSRRRGLVIHRTRRLADEQVVRIDGLPLTSPARTIVDLAGSLRRARMLHIIEEAILVSRTLTRVDLGVALGGTGTMGRQGAAVIGRWLDEQERRPSASALDLLLDRAIERAGVPEPIREAAHPSDRLVGQRVDRWFPDALLIVEADGRSWHQRRAEMARDRERDNEAAAVGVETLRLMWEHLSGDLDGSARTIAAVHRTRLIQLQRDAG